MPITGPKRDVTAPAQEATTGGWEEMRKEHPAAADKKEKETQESV